MRRPWIALASACLLASQPAHAALVINAVRPWAGSTGVIDSSPSQLTLYNSGPATVDLGSHEIRAVGDTVLTAPLPAWLLPPGAYCLVNFGDGPLDDTLAGDSTLVYAIPTAVELQPEAGEAALYSGGTQIDFVCWGFGTASFGAAYFDAVTSAPQAWPAGAFADLTTSDSQGHLQRIPSGYDTNRVTDWQVNSATYVAPPVLESHNDVQIAPANGELVDGSAVTLQWRSVPDAAAYRVQVAEDSTFELLLVDDTVSATSYLVGGVPADAVMYWRIVPDLPGGPYPASVWQFVSTGAAAAPHALHAALQPQVAVPQLYQHKDTPLLCDWSLASQISPVPLHRKTFRPACREGSSPETQSGPWDAPHATTGAHIRACRHCNMYCVRAAFQMVNAFYGGTLTQDEIAVHLWNHYNPGPEGDLGHGQGGAADTMLTVLRWALRDTARRIERADPSIARIRTEILAGRPVVGVIFSRHARWTPEDNESHCVVFDGVEDKITTRKVVVGRNPNGTPIVRTDSTTRTWLHMLDPIPDGSKWYDLTDLRGPLAFYLNATMRGEAGSTLIRANGQWVDRDTDGLVDFDEGLRADGTLDPTRRRYECRADRADTDGDGIGDKQEIRAYTFHAVDHPTHPVPPPVPGLHPNATQRLAFADVDNDGRRAERDADTDGDGFEDGFEDCNRNGKGPELAPNPACKVGGETCVFNPGEPVRRGGPPPRGLKCVSAVPRRPGDGEAVGTPLPDGGCGDVTLDVDEHWSVLDLDVTLSITHPRDGDLDLELISPSGTVVPLALDRGGFGANYEGTVFDDEADAVVSDGVAPFVGRYRPESTLWLVDGEDAFGAWRLHVCDDSLDAAGTLDSLCVSIEFDPDGATAAHEGGAAPDHARPPLAVRVSANPVRGVARILVSVSGAGTTDVEVFDIAGRRCARLAQRWLPAGDWSIPWTGAASASDGVYFVRVRHAGLTRIERLTVAH